MKRPSEVLGEAGAPFTVVFFGKTGAGKSSTLNALFGLGWRTDSSVACTKRPQVACLGHPQHADLRHGPLRVVDLPGIGESAAADRRYEKFYREWVQQADSLVWVTQADTRAYKHDEIFLHKLRPFFRPTLRLTVALNRVDDLAVDEGGRPFDRKARRPSAEQRRLLAEKVEDVRGIFEGAVNGGLRRPLRVVPYTAAYGWGLPSLKRRILTKG